MYLASIIWALLNSLSMYKKIVKNGYRKLKKIIDASLMVSMTKKKNNITGIEKKNNKN